MMIKVIMEIINKVGIKPKILRIIYADIKTPHFIKVHNISS